MNARLANRLRSQFHLFTRCAALPQPFGLEKTDLVTSARTWHNAGLGELEFSCCSLGGNFSARRAQDGQGPNGFWGPSAPGNRKCSEHRPYSAPLSGSIFLPSGNFGPIRMVDLRQRSPGSSAWHFPSAEHPPRPAAGGCPWTVHLVPRLLRPEGDSMLPHTILFVAAIVMFDPARGVLHK